MTLPYLSGLRVLLRGALALAALQARPNAIFAQTGPQPVAITLGAVLDSVQARAPLIEAARARARAARGERTTAGAFGNPYLAYQVENTPFPGGAPLTGMVAERMTTATIPLAPLYQRGARVRQADANVRAADADARVLAQSLTREAAGAYYRAAMAQVAVDAADNVSAWLDSLVAYNRSRVQQGAPGRGRSDTHRAGTRPRSRRRKHAGSGVGACPRGARGVPGRTHRARAIDASGA